METIIGLFFILCKHEWNTNNIISKSKKKKRIIKNNNTRDWKKALVAPDCCIRLTSNLNHENLWHTHTPFHKIRKSIRISHKNIVSSITYFRNPHNVLHVKNQLCVFEMYEYFILSRIVSLSQ